MYDFTKDIADDKSCTWQLFRGYLIVARKKLSLMARFPSLSATASFGAVLFAVPFL
jgi:hypothetical protein